MYELNICHLYPDLLNLYGDRGNIISLKQRLSWRNIKVNIHEVSLNTAFNSEDYDIIFLGGGQDYEQEIIQKDLLHQKASEIKNAINNNKVFLCICGGYQLLGKYYKTWDGKEISLLDAIDIWTIGGKERLIGNYVFECDFLGVENDAKVIGFENHSGRTYLGNNVKPLGKVLSGNGNNDEDLFEGAIFNNVYCTYSHGSLLPKNPKFSDHLITLALHQKYSDFTKLESLDDKLENRAREVLLKRFNI